MLTDVKSSFCPENLPAGRGLYPVKLGKLSLILMKIQTRLNAACKHPWWCQVDTSPTSSRCHSSSLSLYQQVKGAYLRLPPRNMYCMIHITSDAIKPRMCREQDVFKAVRSALRLLENSCPFTSLFHPLTALVVFLIPLWCQFPFTSYSTQKYSMKDEQTKTVWIWSGLIVKCLDETPVKVILTLFDILFRFTFNF